jgi:hypothetical protein
MLYAFVGLPSASTALKFAALVVGYAAVFVVTEKTSAACAEIENATKAAARLNIGVVFIKLIDTIFYKIYKP